MHVTQELRWTLIVLVSKVGPVFCDVILCTIADNSDTEQYLCDAVLPLLVHWIVTAIKRIHISRMCVLYLLNSISHLHSHVHTVYNSIKKIDLYILSESEYRLGWISQIIHQKF